MPTVFDEKTPKTNKATEPLTPISAIVIVGVTVINKKINITENKASKNWIFTLKIFKNLSPNEIKTNLEKHFSIEFPDFDTPDSQNISKESFEDKLT